ncbi:exonuclease domain-containing protein [Nocardia sp. NPDC057668]|uniref:exonuclease domain-containing protein n=1 Tax=Nocardia sp. NPDC057668 TaxID=3346202 RepID=UPI0036736342
MIKGLSFAALDVEIANPKYGSICSIGLAVVRNGIRETTRTLLCRPPVGLDTFGPFQVGIHGITPAMVSGQPRFARRLTDALTLIDGLPVVAYNSKFDMNAIRQACEHSEVPTPAWQYGCALRWAQNQLVLDRYRLPTVAQALGVQLSGAHHDAGSDAAAAADITIAMAHRTGMTTLADLAVHHGAPLRWTTLANR